MDTDADADGSTGRQAGAGKRIHTQFHHVMPTSPSILLLSLDLLAASN